VLCTGALVRRRLSCALRAGWMHATLNLQDSVGIAVELGPTGNEGEGVQFNEKMNVQY
jgi:hypothetical protein